MLPVMVFYVWYSLIHIFPDWDDVLKLPISLPHPPSKFIPPHYDSWFACFWLWFDLSWNFFHITFCFFSVISVIPDQLVLFRCNVQSCLLCFYFFLNAYHHPLSCPTSRLVVLPSSCSLPLFYVINTTAVCVWLGVEFCIIRLIASATWLMLPSGILLALAYLCAKIHWAN